MSDRIRIIDIFAGPGGLGEGFCSFTDSTGNKKFKISLSIEMEEKAHRTLTLRSFFRQFETNQLPDEYYSVMRGELTDLELYSRYPSQAENAHKEAWRATLGEVNEKEVDERISRSLDRVTNWVLIGGPPCQAYSVIGRSRTGGIKAGDGRVYLYRQYLKILAAHSPPVFVMENVPGILSSKVNGKSVFSNIINDLRNPTAAFRESDSKDSEYQVLSFVKMPRTTTLDGVFEYDNRDFVIRSEDYGIPQARHRVILLGIRRDFFYDLPKLIEPVEKVDVKSVISDLPEVRSYLSRSDMNPEEWKAAIRNITQLEWMKTESDLQDCVLSTVKNILRTDQVLGSEFIGCRTDPLKYAEWYKDARIGGVSNHFARGHIAGDLHRYIFASCFARVNNRAPNLKDFPDELLPDHKNAMARDRFVDRFKVQQADKPSSTVTSHISKDGHYYIHPDPVQARSLTVREAARLQTFPDNYFFTGPRTSQFVQVGNAVPPLLARQLADTVYNIFQRADK